MPATPMPPAPAPTTTNTCSCKVSFFEPRGADQARQGHRPGALDVVVEAGNHLAVAVEHVKGRAARKILPLDDGLGIARLGRLHEAVEKLVVGGPGQAGVVHAQIQRIVDQILAVGAHVEFDRQGLVGADAARRRVEAQLANRDRHAAEALVADAQNGAGIGGDDHPHVVERHIVQHLVDPVHVQGADRQPARVAVDVREDPHRLAHRGGVENRQQLFEVVGQNAVEQHLVAVLQGAHEFVLVRSVTCWR